MAPGRAAWLGFPGPWAPGSSSRAAGSEAAGHTGGPSPTPGASGTLAEREVLPSVPVVCRVADPRGFLKEMLKAAAW